MIKELIFKIEEYENNPKLQEIFLIRFIDNFVYKNRWFVGGNFVLYDIENKTDMNVMKQKLLTYLKRQKTFKIKKVVFQKFDETIDDFVDIEEIELDNNN